MTSLPKKVQKKNARQRIPHLQSAKNEPALTAHEEAYLRLRNAILIGAISPGEPLTIRGLATALEVSPTPVREAIRRLSSEGALTVLDNRRVTTVKLNPAQFQEILLLRAHIETFAALRAMPYVNEVLIVEIEKTDEALDQAIADKDFEASVILNQQFHQKLYQANPEQMVMPAIYNIWLKLGPYLKIMLEDEKNLSAVDYHKVLIEALRERNPDKVSAAIQNDIEHGLGRYFKDLKI